MKPQHSPIPKKYPELPAVVLTYLDGLEAAVDGRGWNQEHEKAKNFIYRACNAHEALVLASKCALADLEGIVMEYELDGPARTTIEELKYALKLAGKGDPQ